MAKTKNEAPQIEAEAALSKFEHAPVAGWVAAFVALQVGALLIHIL